MPRPLPNADSAEPDHKFGGRQVKSIAKLCLLALVTVASAAVAACGSNASLSPLAPSAAAAGRGAVITGRVTGVAAAATTRDAVLGATSATTLTVRIVGTNISSTVDGAGQFTLTGVPPGTVQLKFSGNGIDATITLANVSAAERITITVSLRGSDARVEFERRERDDDEDDEDDADDNEVEGSVSNLSGICPALTFTVQHTTVRTNGMTVFDDGPCTVIANGTHVEVEGARQGDGSIVAASVEIED